MKAFEILGGKAYVVELPEGATNHHIHKKKVGSRLRYTLSNGINTSIELPQGNWRIIGMLSEVTEEQAAVLVQKRIHPWDHKLWTYRDYTREHKFPRDAVVLHTALQSLESAILAEGYTFKNKYGDVRPRIDDYSSVFQYRNDAIDYDYEEERVLCRERCLLLRRVDG